MKTRTIMQLVALSAVAVVVVIWRRASEQVDAALGKGTWAKAKLGWKLETVWKNLLTQ